MELSYKINSCPIKTHHSSNAFSCDLSKVVNKCVMYLLHVLFYKCNVIAQNFNLSDCVNINA